MIPYARRREYGFVDPNESPLSRTSLEAVELYYQSGVISLNEALLAMGQSPVPGGFQAVLAWAAGSATSGTFPEPIEPYTPQPEYEEMSLPYPE